jgi:hypothetical protein
MRYLICKLSMSLYIDQHPFHNLFLPTNCRLYKETDNPKTNKVIFNRLNEIISR